MKILENDIYIDDVITSVNFLENTKIIVRDLQIIFASGGFELKKWESNHSSIRNLFPT